MPVQWKLTCADPAINATLADLDITAAVLSLQSCAPDQLTLTHEPDAGFIAAALLPYNSICTLTRDNVPFFKGRCRSTPRTGSLPAESIQYELLGPWFDLERITYAQRWKTWDVASETSTWQYKNRLILGQAEDGSAMTIGQIIADVITYAATKGAMVALPSGLYASWNWPATKIPWEEITNLKCSDVITRLLAFIPDVKVQFDYSQTTPVLNLVSRSTARTITGAVGTDDISGISITERHDMAPPGVRVKFERQHSVAGTSYESTEIQEAGNPDHMDAIDITLPLAGANLTTQTVRIISEPLPLAGDPPATDWLDKPWWKAQVKTLAEYADADLTLIECTPTVEPPADGSDAPELSSMPYELIEGSIPEWLTGDVHTARVTLDLKYSHIDRRIADGKKIAEVKETTLSHSLILTSVPTGTRTRTEGDFAEPAPEGFAAALYAAWSPLQYEGNIQLELDECTDYARPGDNLNLTGGLAAWATMNAHIQQVQYDIAAGRVTLVTGPARRVDPATLLSLMRRLRARALPINHLARTTGNPLDRGGNIHGGDIIQDKRTTATPGRTTYLNVSPDYDPDAPYIKEIELDPAAIVKENETAPAPVQIKPREINTIEVINGVAVHAKRHFLVSGPDGATTPFDPDDPGNTSSGGPCDQNTHPGTADYDTGEQADDTHPGEQADDNPETGTGGYTGADEDNTDHPGAQDCYTTT